MHTRFAKQSRVKVSDQSVQASGSAPKSSQEQLFAAIEFVPDRLQINLFAVSQGEFTDAFQVLGFAAPFPSDFGFRIEDEDLSYADAVILAAFGIHARHGVIRRQDFRHDIHWLNWIPSWYGGERRSNIRFRLPSWINTEFQFGTRLVTGCRECLAEDLLQQRVQPSRRGFLNRLSKPILVVRLFTVIPAVELLQREQAAGCRHKPSLSELPSYLITATCSGVFVAGVLFD